MSTKDRAFQIDQMLTAQGSASKTALMKRLGVSWATLKRDLSYLRDELNAPIVFDREQDAYRFEHTGGKPAAKKSGKAYALPEAWYSAQEVHAMITIQTLLKNLSPKGQLGPHIEPLLARINGILSLEGAEAGEAGKRIEVDANLPSFDAPLFPAIATALLKRKRIAVAVKTKGSKDTVAHELSPQRLVQQRNTWHLEAWCHKHNELDRYPLDQIKQVELLDSKAKNVALKGK